MCLLCHALAGEEDWTQVRGDADARAAAGHRRRRVVGTVLGCYGLEFRDWGRGAPGVVANRKGAARVANGLTGVWAAAEQLAGRPLDPLDPALLARLERAARDG